MSKTKTAAITAATNTNFEDYNVYKGQSKVLNDVMIPNQIHYSNISV